MKERLLSLYIAIFGLLTLSTAAIADEYQDLVLADGPIAYWPFEQNADFVLYDQTGNAPDFSNNSTPEFVNSELQIADAVAFDGQEQYLSLNTILPAFATPFSLELWVKFDDVTDRQILLQQGEGDAGSVPFGLHLAGTSRTYDVGEQTAGHITFVLNDGQQTVALSDPQVAIAGQWYHLAVTYSGSTLSLYRNGELAKSVSYSNGIAPTSQLFYLGGQPGVDGMALEAVHGLMGDVALYSKALALADIAEHVETGAGNPAPTQLVIDTDTVISATETIYDEQEIVVDGASLTIDGSHSFSSLTLRNNASLTHSLAANDALSLEVSGGVEIDSTSKIDVSALGQLPQPQNCAACGGAHASYGGGRGQQPYGDYKQPLESGSGGKHAVDGAQGTRGGGRIRLQAQRLIVNGSILANGEAHPGYRDGGYIGGGAGGSVFLEVEEIGGSGTISANGGTGYSSYSSGGSGGRVAVYYSPGAEFDFLGQISAKGGTGKVYGGPGSVFLHDGAITRLSIRNNNGEFGNLKYWQVELGSPGVRTSSPMPAAMEGAYYLYGGVNNPESSLYQNISLSGAGFSQEDIDQAKLTLASEWLQSSYHGEDQGELRFRFLNASGEVISEEASGLTTTEAYKWEPRSFSVDVPSGAVSVDLIVHSLRQRGSNNDAYFDNIKIKAHFVNHDPLNSEDDAGLLVFDNHRASSKVEPYFLGNMVGAEILLRDAALEVPDGTDLGSSSIRGNNNARVNFGGTIISGASDFVVDGYDLTAASSYSFSSLFAVLNRSTVTAPAATEVSSPLNISADDIYVAGNSSIDVSAKGLLPQSGVHWKSGGSYGGIGGRDSASGTSDPTFGDFKRPIEFGVGGYGADATIQGSRGGGALKLVASNRFEVYGDILANAILPSPGVGAGSGGSIWIEAKELIGNTSTLIEASGGQGYQAGTGGGGRIAIYYDSLSGFSPENYVLARAGSNYSSASSYGGPGTVYLYDRSLTSNNGRLQIQNRGISGSYEPYRLSGNVETPINFIQTKVVLEDGAHLAAPVSGSHFNHVYVKAEGNFTVANNNLDVNGLTLELRQDYSFESITVRNIGKITTPVASDEFTSGITLSATDFYISSNSTIDVSAKGLHPESGGFWKSGGSYGGLGGTDPSSGAVAPIFGSFEAPTDFGVGGYGADAAAEGSRGGGAIKLVASNRFEVYGDILANAILPSPGVGAGSGGSIWIEAKELIGNTSTLIEASGGQGYQAGTGGGGRIAIYYDSLSGFSPENYVLARAGSNYSSASAYGGPGTVYLYDRSLTLNNGRLQIRNWGVAGSYEPYRLDGDVETPISFYYTKVVLEDGAHLAVPVSGNHYSHVYVTAEGDFTVANNNLLVDGFTLEVNRDFLFEKIALKNSAKLTTPRASSTFTSGITLSAENIHVDSSSSIDVSWKGRLASGGIHFKSGGSYGGLGGRDPISGTTNPTYGGLEGPTEFGTGGHPQEGISRYTLSGGSVKIVASNRLELYGDILANGSCSTSNYTIGGASGGSIWIDAKELIGNGSTNIEASGGGGRNAASGGGGRIAIYYDSARGLNWNNQVYAKPGGNCSGTTAYGDPGTVYLYNRSLAENNATLHVVGNGISSDLGAFRISGDLDVPVSLHNVRVSIADGAHLSKPITGSNYSSVHVIAEGNFTVPNGTLLVDGFTLELSQDYTFDSVIVRNGGKITTPIASNEFTSGITLSAIDFYIDSSSYIDVSGKGLGAMGGNSRKAGGSYGGLGGYDSTTGPSNPIFGSFEFPTDFGVGGYGAEVGEEGGRGGGAIKLVASNRFEVYGDILANGDQKYQAGGGSGGSIWIEANEIVGSGSTLINAQGGTGNRGATGGGGRVAVYYNSIAGFSPEDRVFARAGLRTGTIPAWGGVGTVYLHDRSLPGNNGLLQIINHNNGSWYQPYRLSGQVVIPHYFKNARAVIEDGASLSTSIRGNSYSNSYVEALGDFSVINNDLVVDGFTLELGQDYSFESITVQNSGKITTPAVSEGFVSGITLSVVDLYVSSDSSVDASAKGDLPSDEVSYRSGGSYGGSGGILDGGTSNAIYGSAVAPLAFGTGGRYQDDSQPGLRGGGVIKLVADRLQLYGDIYVNGAGSTGYTGGGSGGSIWLDIGELIAGSYTDIQANGGHGTHAGAGGGGRIAIYYESLSGLNTSRVKANSGGYSGSGVAGEAGTIHIAEKTAPPRVRSVTPSGYHNEAINSAIVQFSIGIDDETMDTNDFELLDSAGSPITVTAVTSLDDIRYQIDFAQTLGEGAYTLNIGPDIFGTNGLGMDQDQDGIEQEPEDDKFSTQIVIDLTRPAVLTVDQPSAPEVNTSNKRWVTLTGSREDDTAILVDGNEIVANGSGNWSGSYYLSEGESTIEVVAQDLSGNLSSPVTLVFNVDSKAPNITGANPTGSINITPPFVTLVVTEEGSGIDLQNSSISVKRNGVPLSGSVDIFEGQVQFTPEAPFLDGDYQIVARIADKLGNLSTQRTYNFELDYTPPEVPVLGEYPSVTTVNAQVFTGTKEAGSAVLVNGSLAVVESSETTWSTQVALLQGDNTISFAVRDAAGNESEPALAEIRYDNNPPGPVAFTIDPNGSGAELLLDWSGYDEFANGNDIGEYRIYQSAGAFTDIAGKSPVAVMPQGSKQFRIGGLSRDTEAHFAVVAYDTQALFNPSVTSVAAVPVDVQAPDEVSNLVVEPGADSLQLRWNPSANSAGDLAGYKVAFVEDPSGRVDDIPLVSLSDPNAPVQHQVTGLEAATSYPVRVYAYDDSGNASNGVSDAGTTLLPNPATVTAEPKSSKIEISWSSVVPYALLKNYAVYVQEGNFSSTEGLQPRAVRSKGTSSASEHIWSLAGLENGITYYVAVAAVNISGGSDPAVTPVAVTPEADTEGPTIEAAQYQQGTQAGAELLDLSTTPQLVQDGRFRITAVDESDVARVEFYVDGTLLGTEYASSAGVFSRNIALLSLADGEHSLTVKAYDVWENVTIGQYTFSVALAAPPAPVITSPSEGWLTNTPLVTIYGNAEKQTRVQIYRNGVATGSIGSVDSNGQFQMEVTLEEGDNPLTAAAEYPNRGGFGEQSNPRTLELNTAIPDAPSNLTVIERELGQISLNWDAVSSDDGDNPIAGYNVYRASAPFTSVQAAQQINNQLLGEPKFTDMPAEDGDYVYAVTAVNEAATESNLSSLVEAAADSEGPHALAVSYTSNGLVDSVSGRHAPGTVEVAVQFDEPLRNKPYFALVPEGGVPLTVDLSQDYGDDTRYSGSFVIEPGMLSGTAYAVMSAHDNVGNRGTLIEEGGSLLIDAKGPEVIALTLNPGEPLQVDEQNGLPVEVVLQLDDEVKPGAMPTLVPRIDTVEIAEYSNGISLTRDAQSIEGQPLWVGSFVLPVSAGQDESGNPAVESLSFSYLAQDDLDNAGSKVRAPNRFQVYQGELPPLDIPRNLKAIAQPNGGVSLEWGPVEEARYVLYRKAESDAEFTELLRLSETTTTDTLPSDGQYLYAIASERSDNGQTSVSAMSDPVAVSADSIAPAIPSELALELNGAGIVSTWQAPSADAQGNAEDPAKLTYNLYRLNLAEGESATAEMLQAIEPLQTGIPDTIALDINPSESEHAYVITALDEAGNESAPSETAYLNFGLLPVTDLSIQLDASGNPELQWNHSGAAIAGYRVFLGEGVGEDVGGEGELQEITSNLIPHNGNPTTFVDEGYTATGQGATVERRYTVIAEDAQGATSIGHSLLLPALSVEVIEAEEGEASLKRGVMNEVRFRVQNRGSGDISDVKLFATVSDGGVERQHQSASFSVAAGGLVEVPIVIGGYAGLDSLSQIQLRLEQSPLPGEAVFIHAEDEVLVGDDALRLDLETDTVYRGGIGKVRFTLENTSEVETEVLMARSNGGNPSNEARIRIEDADGNLLATQPVQQFTGDVITVSSGETVARVQPGETFVSGWVEVPIPEAAPDRVSVVLEIDQFRYHTGKPTQVAIEGNGTRTQASLQETAYTGELTSVAPELLYSADETVTIAGRALDRGTQAPLGNVPLTLVMEVRGFERSASVITDSEGNFTYEFDPQGQSGNWQLSVIHPDSLSRPNQGQFSVLTSEVSPRDLNIHIPRNYTQTVPISVKAGQGSELANVRLVSAPEPGAEQVQIPEGIHLDLGNVIELAPQQKGVINLALSGDNLAPENGSFYFQVLAEVNGVAQVLEDIALQYRLSESRPVIKAMPSFIDTGVALDTTTTENFQVKNTGFDLLRNASLSLLDGEQNPAPDWMRLNGTASLGDMEIGASRDISLTFSPDASVAQGNYEFQLVIEGDGGYRFTVPIFVAVVTAEQGDAFFHISDIYTATLNESNELIPGLGGARIELQNEQVLTETRTINSDANGEALLKDLPAGRYAYRVSASDHESVSGRLWVKPGTTVAEEVFLMNRIVTVEWQVNEINLEDRYEIKLEATFETHVPVAVVMLDPISVTLPDMKKGDVFTGELSLTNYGLIRADDVSGALPSGNDVVSFEFLAEVPDTLEAGEVVYIPYRITALRDFNPNEEGAATGAGCGSYSYQYNVSYQSQCANGQIVPGGTSTHWSTASYGSCGGSGGSGGNYYYYGGGGGSGGGYYGGGGGTAIGSEETLQCEPDPSCDECNKDNTAAQ